MITFFTGDIFSGDFFQGLFSRAPTERIEADERAISGRTKNFSIIYYTLETIIFNNYKMQIIIKRDIEFILNSLIYYFLKAILHIYQLASIWFYQPSVQCFFSLIFFIRFLFLIRIDT